MNNMDHFSVCYEKHNMFPKYNQLWRKIADENIEKLTEYCLQSEILSSPPMGRGSAEVTKSSGNLQSTISTVSFSSISASVESNSMLTYSRLHACSTALSRWLQFEILKPDISDTFGKLLLQSSNNTMTVWNLVLHCTEFRIDQCLSLKERYINTDLNSTIFWKHILERML